MTNLLEQALEENGARHRIGGNFPPEQTLPERLNDMASELLTERDGKFSHPIGIWLSRTALADDDQLETATNFIAKAKALAGRFEAMRVTAKKPHDDAAKTVQTFFRAAVQPLEQAEAHVRGLMGGYQAKKLADARAAQTRASEEARKAAAAAQTAEDVQRAGELAAQATLPVEPIRTQTSGGAMSSMTTFWWSEVVDIDQVPREFLSYDERKVKAYLAGLPKGATPSKPGMKFTETVRSIVRGK